MDPKPEITPEDLAAAERVAGVEFTPSERKLILEGLPLALAFYRRRREALLDATTPPPPGSGPRPPGTHAERRTSWPFVLSLAGRWSHSLHP